MSAVLTLLALLVFAVGAALFGNEVGRSKSEHLWWVTAVAAIDLLVLCAFAEYIRELQFVEPFSWLLGGKKRWFCYAVTVPFILGVLAPRFSQERMRMMLRILTMVAVTRAGLLPAIAPISARGELANLRSTIDAEGVCRQQTWYTSAPAAAVTALRVLGIQATESELALAMDASKYAGAQEDQLVAVLEEQFRKQGLQVELRYFDHLEQLKSWPAAIAVVKLTPFVDHHVAVLAINSDGVVIGDPFAGKHTVGKKEFESDWRRVAIVLRRKS